MGTYFDRVEFTRAGNASGRCGMQKSTHRVDPVGRDSLPHNPDEHFVTLLPFTKTRNIHGDPGESLDAHTVNVSVKELFGVIEQRSGAKMGADLPLVGPEVRRLCSQMNSVRTPPGVPPLRTWHRCGDKHFVTLEAGVGQKAVLCRVLRLVLDVDDLKA